jgi:hypothetical protein
MSSHYLARALRNGALAAMTCATLCAQQVPIVETSPRPVSDGVLTIEALSGIAVNYEDLQYTFVGDTQDMRDWIANANQSPQALKATIPVLVPKAPPLSTQITVDPITQQLINPLSTSAALNEIISTANAAPGRPGTFQSESYSGVFFVEPTIQHARDGTETPATPILTVPVTVAAQNTIAMDLIQSIFAQVSKQSGFQIQGGMLPLGALYKSKVTLAVSNEPAKYVLAQVLVAVFGDRPASYQMLFDPISGQYFFSVHVLPNRQLSVSPPVVIQPSPSDAAQRGGTKTTTEPPASQAAKPQ